MTGTKVPELTRNDSGAHLLEPSRDCLLTDGEFIAAVRLSFHGDTQSLVWVLCGGIGLNNSMRFRSVVVKIHRYLGLSLALFLIIIAATGSIIAFYPELERWANPHQHVVTPQTPGWTLHDLLVIREKLQAQDPRSELFLLNFPQRPDESVFSRVGPAINPATGQPYEIDYDEVFANPYTGERLGERAFGTFSLQPENLIAQIYYLHYALVLPLTAGIWLMGMVALLWALDCFAGLYLTFPPGKKPDKKQEPGKTKSFLNRWKPAWQIKLGAAANRIIYDMHRAFSLWLWLLLLIFAVTGFALNLGGPYAQIVSKFSAYAHFQEMPPGPALDKPLINPPVDWFKALELGQRYFKEQAQIEGFVVEKPAALEYRRDHGMYFYSSHTSRDLRDAEGSPTETNSSATAATIAIDARDGRFLGLQLPTGQRAGNTVTSWINAMHVTAIWGLPWQIAVAVLGILIVIVTITGVLVWWRKRKSLKPKRAAVPVASPLQDNVQQGGVWSSFP